MGWGATRGKNVVQELAQMLLINYNYYFLESRWIRLVLPFTENEKKNVYSIYTPSDLNICRRKPLKVDLIDIRISNTIASLHRRLCFVCITHYSLFKEWITLSYSGKWTNQFSWNSKITEWVYTNNPQPLVHLCKVKDCSTWQPNLLVQHQDSSVQVPSDDMLHHMGTSLAS